MSLKYKVLKSILLISLLCFPVLGTNCEKVVDALTGSNNDTVIGTWTLVKMLGNAQDVCLGERAVFGSSGSVSLTCPNSSTITRSYTFNNYVLTYASNNLSYNVTFSTVNGIDKMTLTGRNGVERELTYDKISN